MDIKIKGLKFGNVLITTRKQLEKNMIIKIESDEVWDLFIRALKEGKIKLPSFKKVKEEGNQWN